MYVSEGASVHVGMSQFELIGNALADFVHDDDVAMLAAVMGLAHAGDDDFVYSEAHGRSCTSCADQ